MGTYCYRIKTKPKVLGDGNKVHLATFAYKAHPDWRVNRDWHRRHVGPAERAWAKKPEDERRNVLVVEGGRVEAGAAVIEIDFCPGYYYDDSPIYIGFLMERDGKLVLVRYARANELVKNRTAFPDMLALLEAPGGYRPSCDMSDPETRDIADYYDVMQARRGSEKRAYRYGVRSHPDNGLMLESHLAMKLEGLL